MFIALALAASFLTVDGDTFDLKTGERIRIANIDAPETDQARCDAELRLGKLAERRLGELLNGGGKVEIKRGDPVDGRLRDRHKRTLATVSVDGRDVGKILVAEGFVRPWEGKRRSWCERRRR